MLPQLPVRGRVGVPVRPSRPVPRLPLLLGADPGMSPWEALIIGLVAGVLITLLGVWTGGRG